MRYGYEALTSAGARTPIPQGYARCVRPILFQTSFEEWKYATHGGTLFIVQFEERVFGVTCRHVFKDFEPSRLFVAPRTLPEKGDSPAFVERIWYPQNPTGEAKESDILDLAVLTFHESVKPEFFGGQVYVIRDRSVVRARIGDTLEVFGFLKSHTVIDGGRIGWANAHLDLHDGGIVGSDPSLRMAAAEWAPTEIRQLSGISGSPVFNKSANGLSGMVVRGGLSGNLATIYYLDFVNVAGFIETVAEGGGTCHITG